MTIFFSVDSHVSNLIGRFQMPITKLIGVIDIDNLFWDKTKYTFNIGMYAIRALELKCQSWNDSGIWH